MSKPQDVVSSARNTGVILGAAQDVVVLRRYPTPERAAEVRALVRRWHAALVIVG